MKSLIKVIKHDAETFGGVSDYFYNKKEQEDLILYMEKEKKIPDYYYFEIWSLIGLHGADVLSVEDRIHIEDLYEEATSRLLKDSRPFC